MILSTPHPHPFRGSLHPPRICYFPLKSSLATVQVHIQPSKVNITIDLMLRCYEDENDPSE
jgi:hypothetical protein